MVLPSDQAPPGDDWIPRKLADLERQIRELRAERRLEAATIGDGGLTIAGGTLKVLYGNGHEALLVGDMPISDGTTVQGIMVRRPSGAPSLWIWGDDTGRGYVAVQDEQGNIIVSDDAASGQGLARPWLPYTTVRTADYVTAPLSTTNATMTPLWTITGEKQHPMIRVVVITQSDAGTTGEVQIKDTLASTVIAGPVSIPAADNTARTLDGVVSGTFSGFVKVDVELRRTGGTGNVRVLVVYAMGRQT